MKIINSETGKEISLEDWEKEDCRLDFTGLTKYQEKLINNYSVGEKCNYYTKIGRERIKLRIRAIIETDHEPDQRKIFYSDKAGLVFIISKTKLDSLMRLLICNNLFELHEDIRSNDMYTISMYYKTKKKGNLLLYLKGHIGA